MAAHDRIRLTGQLPRGLPATGALSVSALAPLPWRRLRACYPQCHHSNIICFPSPPSLGRSGKGSPLSLAFRAGTCEHAFVIVCVLLPRFALAVAAGGRDVLAAGPVALAPEPGREQFIGEASAAAEAYGVRAGLRLGEALARCPTLRLVAPDPAGVADAWDAHVRALEGIGAAVDRSRGATPPIRLGAAPARFAAFAAARRARARRPEITPMAAAALAAYMAPLPVSFLLARPEVAMLPDALERFGIRTMGALVKLPRAALADRFGAAGPLARDLAQGKDTPLV